MKLLALLSVCVAATCAVPSGRYEIVRNVPSYADPLPSISFSTTPAPYIAKNVYGKEGSQPQQKVYKNVPILRYFLDADDQGTYSLETASADGSTLSQEGHLKDLGDVDGPVQVTSGTYSFVGDDEKTYTVKFIADENGFQAIGSHIPTPPPIPEEIKKSIIEALQDSSSDDDDGSYRESDDSLPLTRSTVFDSSSVKVLTTTPIPVQRFQSFGQDTARFPISSLKASSY